MGFCLHAHMGRLGFNARSILVPGRTVSHCREKQGLPVVLPAHTHAITAPCVYCACHALPLATARLGRKRLRAHTLLACNLLAPHASLGSSAATKAPCAKALSLHSCLLRFEAKTTPHATQPSAHTNKTSQSMPHGRPLLASPARLHWGAHPML